MKAYFQQFPNNTPVALEASGSWYWLADLLQELELDVNLAHPYKVKLIAESKIKTDKIDARVLADLLRTNFLPTAYLPDKDTREFRELLRYRLVLVSVRTSLKNRIHALLDKLGIIVPTTFDSLYCKAGIRFLQSLQLRDAFQLALDSFLQLIRQLNELIKDADKRIKARCKADPRAQLLMGMHGIGFFSAYLLLAEIGSIERFRSAKKLCGYTGIVPRVNNSGKHTYLGPITKRGNAYIRFAMVEAAQTAVKHDPYFAEFYHKLKLTKGASKAITAVARKMLCVVWYLLTHNMTYDAYRRNRSMGYARG